MPTQPKDTRTLLQGASLRLRLGTTSPPNTPTSGHSGGRNGAEPRPKPVLRRCRFRILPLLGGLILLVGLPVVYALNASHAWRAGGLVPVQHWRLLPASAYPAVTIQVIGITVVFAAGLWVAASLPSRYLKVLIALILAGAGVVALLTLHHRLVPRSAYEWTPLFASRNHYAAFACLMFPLALTSGARSQYEAFLSGRLSNPSGLWYLVAGLLAVSVIQTASRAGLAVLFLQFIGFMWLQWRIRRDHPFSTPSLSTLRKVCMGAALVLAIGLGIASLIRFQPVLRLMDGDLDFRGVVRSDTWSMWRSRPWWGTGPGSFSTVFPYYQTLPVEQYYFRHAHCEPLQFLAELGILGGGLTILGALLIMKGAGRSFCSARPLPAFRELEGYGLLLALGGVVLHGLVDFPFRHPLILLVAGVWGGILAGAYTRSRAVAESTFRR